MYASLVGNGLIVRSSHLLYICPTALEQCVFVKTNMALYSLRVCVRSQVRFLLRSQCSPPPPLFPNSWSPILEYVNEQFDRYLNEEVSINRKKVIPDSRVHCCLYFIPPSGHRYMWYLFFAFITSNSLPSIACFSVNVVRMGLIMEHQGLLQLHEKF